MGGINEILDLWAEDQAKEIQHWVLIKKIVEMKNVTERHAERYLQILKEEKKLEPIKKGSKAVFYKPYKEAWEDYVSMKQRAGLIGTYVNEALSNSIADAKKITTRINDQLWNEINSNTIDGYDGNAEAFDKAMDCVLCEKPTTDERKKFYLFYDSLIKSCLQPLRDPTVFARLLTEGELPEIVEEQVDNLVRKYMAMWDFLYKHPRAASEVNESLEEDDPCRKKAKKIAHHRPDS